VLAVLAGRRTCAWALRRPTGTSPGDPTGRVRRRRPAAGPFAEVRAVDRASVWRSPSLRRGLVVLGLLPGAIAAGAGLDWPSLVLLPGLVAAGAGLLFGVNAFCLDGSGALWLESLPRRPAAAYWSKVLVVAEVCVVATAVTVVAGALRTPRPPTPGELAALLACTGATSLRVVAVCMHLSVHRPHRADLRGPRDTPAPPGVMALYSARLAVSTTVLALVFAGLAEVAPWQWSVLLAAPVAALSLRRLAVVARQWEDVTVRTRVAGTVASG
jgi:hypothetical protein